MTSTSTRRGRIVRRGAERLLGGGEGPAAQAALAKGGEGAGLAQVEEGPRSGVLGAGDGVFEDVRRRAGVLEPQQLVREVGKDARAEVALVGGVGVVEGGVPEAAGGGVAALVEVLPGDGLGEEAARVCSLCPALGV